MRVAVFWNLYSGTLDEWRMGHYNKREVKKVPVFQTRFKKAAKKYLEKLNRETQISILTAIQGLCQFPPKGDLKKMAGVEGKYRLRVGMYRVIFSYGKDGNIIIILIEEIGPRGDIYK